MTKKQIIDRAKELNTDTEYFGEEDLRVRLDEMFGLVCAALALKEIKTQE